LWTVGGSQVPKAYPKKKCIHREDTQTSHRKAPTPRIWMRSLLAVREIKGQWWNRQGTSLPQTGSSEGTIVNSNFHTVCIKVKLLCLVAHWFPMATYRVALSHRGSVDMDMLSSRCHWVHQTYHQCNNAYQTYLIPQCLTELCLYGLCELTKGNSELFVIKVQSCEKGYWPESSQFLKMCAFLYKPEPTNPLLGVTVRDYSFCPFLVSLLSQEVLLHYLDVYVVLAVLDGLYVGVEDGVLTGSCWPTISRAQHLRKWHIKHLQLSRSQETQWYWLWGTLHFVHFARKWARHPWDTWSLSYRFN